MRVLGRRSGPLVQLPLVARCAFTSADSATVLPACEFGGFAWVQQVGTWGVATNQAYNPSATARAIATADTGCVNVHAKCTVTGVANTLGIVVRFVDASNYLRIVTSPTLMSIRQRITGTETILFSAPVSAVDGDEVGARVVGARIASYLNGKVVDVQPVHAALLASTLHGIAGGNTGNSGNRWDNFSLQRVVRW